MDASLRTLLQELEDWGNRNDEREQDYPRRMLNLHPDSAQFISILIRSSRRTRLLEIGTSNGYSTIWLAWAAHHQNGRVTSIDGNPAKHVLADENLKRAGLRDIVELVQGDATEVVRGLPGPFDFVFFDADRNSAVEQLRILLPKLTPGALVLADNALSHAEELAAYVAAVERLPNFEHLILPLGKGLSLAYETQGS